MASDEMILDLTNYKDRVGNRVVPGRYTVVVEDAEPDTAKSGNAMVNLWFRVQGGEHDGATIVDRLVITEKSLFRVVGFMQAIGLPTPKKRFKMNIKGFIGRTLDIDVEDGEPYNGRVKSEVRGYMRAVGASAAAATAEPADLEDLAGETETAVTGAADPEPAASAVATETVPQTVPAAADDELELESIDLG